MILLSIYVIVAVASFAWGYTHYIQRDSPMSFSTQFGGILLAAIFWPLAAVVILAVIPYVVVRIALKKGDD